MQSNKFLSTLAGAVAAMTVASMARGDGPCNAGFRDSTPAERGTIMAILQAAKKALPPAPAGWVILGDDQISVTGTLCRDYERIPWNYSYTRYYQRVDDQDARNKIIADAAAAAVAAMKQKQPRLDAVMARINKLSQEQVALVQKGDIVRAQALNVDLAKAQEDYQKILDEGDSEQQMNAATEKASRDMQMNITVQFNSPAEAHDSDAKSLPLPPGARAAFRWSSGGNRVNEDHALILIGQWTPTGEGRWQSLGRANVPAHAAHVISIRVVADPNRLAPTVASIDVKSLATALQH